MNVSKLLIIGVLASTMCMVVPVMAAHITFTGDVAADFTAPHLILTIIDPGGLTDVGFPSTSPDGTAAPGTPGWDMSDFRLTYEPSTDILYVGLNSGGIAGDADGDGNPSATSHYLSDLGGVDQANFAFGESFAVYFDFDQDGNLDVIAGVSGATDITGFVVATTAGFPSSPATNFGTPIGGATGTVTLGPDVEFTILNFSALPGQDGDGQFNVTAFMGSLDDDGIGEDFIAHAHNPSTNLTITSSASAVVTGGTVDLTITEENDGNHDLFDVVVEVTQEGGALATLTDPPDSGDAVDPGVLNVGETWTWVITSDPITADATTFQATADANDPLDAPITYPGDPEEQDQVDVDVLVPSTITTISSSASSVLIGGTVNLTITEQNDGETDLTSPQVVVTQDGGMLATLTSPPDSGDVADPGVLNVGETWSWTIPSDPIIANPTLFVAIGSGTDPAGNVITYPDDAEERDDVEVIPLNPSTITTISSSATDVASGDTVDLTVTEQNDGDVDLTAVQVVVNDGTSDIAILTAPPDSGDVADPGVLNVGETWTWTITSVVITSTTTFTATGSGTDPAGNIITYPDDPDEQDAVTVNVIGNEGCTPGYWKNNAKNWEANAWCDAYSPTDSFSSVFGVVITIRGKGKSTITDPTLLEALDANGGGINALARHGVAALLNACSDCVNYVTNDPQEIIDFVFEAIDSGDPDFIQFAHELLAYYNESGCPVNQHGDCVGVEEVI